MAPSKSSKFLDALTSQPIGHDAAMQVKAVGCAMAIVTRNDFDCVHEMNFLQKGKIERAEENEKNI